MTKKAKVHKTALPEILYGWQEVDGDDQWTCTSSDLAGIDAEVAKEVGVYELVRRGKLVVGERSIS